MNHFYLYYNYVVKKHFPAVDREKYDERKITKNLICDLRNDLYNLSFEKKEETVKICIQTLAKFGCISTRMFHFGSI